MRERKKAMQSKAKATMKDAKTIDEIMAMASKAAFSASSKGQDEEDDSDNDDDCSSIAAADSDQEIRGDDGSGTDGSDGDAIANIFKVGNKSKKPAGQASRGGKAPPSKSGASTTAPSRSSQSKGGSARWQKLQKPETVAKAPEARGATDRLGGGDASDVTFMDGRVARLKKGLQGDIAAIEALSDEATNLTGTKDDKSAVGTSKDFKTNVKATQQKVTSCLNKIKVSDGKIERSSNAAALNEEVDTLNHLRKKMQATDSLLKCINAGSQGIMSTWSHVSLNAMLSWSCRHGSSASKSTQLQTTCRGWDTSRSCASFFSNKLTTSRRQVMVNKSARSCWKEP